MEESADIRLALENTERSFRPLTEQEERGGYNEEDPASDQQEASTRRLAAQSVHGATLIMTTPWEATLALNEPVNLPKSFFCQRSRTDAERCAG
jgi:hypothetical protein